MKRHECVGLFAAAFIFGLLVAPSATLKAKCMTGKPYTTKADWNAAASAVATDCPADDLDTCFETGSEVVKHQITYWAVCGKSVEKDAKCNSTLGCTACTVTAAGQECKQKFDRLKDKAVEAHSKTCYQMFGDAKEDGSYTEIYCNGADSTCGVSTITVDGKKFGLSSCKAAADANKDAISVACTNLATCKAELLKLLSAVGTAVPGNVKTTPAAIQATTTPKTSTVTNAQGHLVTLLCALAMLAMRL